MGRKRKWAEWTQSCSGCFESEDGHPVGQYPWDEKAGCYVGSGCHECGYHGKVRSKILLSDLEEMAREQHGTDSTN